MFSLFFDEDSAERPLVSALRGAGFDCLTAFDAGRRGLSDEDQLALAAAAGTVIYTRNTKDFAGLTLRGGIQAERTLALLL